MDLRFGIRHFPLLAGLFATVLAIIITAQQGPVIALSGLGLDYAQAAHQLAAGIGYCRCDGSLIGYHPPGYSSALAVMLTAGFSFIDAVRVVGGLTAGITAFFTATILVRTVKRPEMIVLGTMLVVLNPVLIRWQADLNSDALHAAIIVAFIAAMVAFLDTREQKYLLWAGVAAGCAGLVRYIGVTAALTGAIMLIASGSHRTFRNRLRELIVFSVLAVLPLAIFAIYNKLASGTMVGRVYGFQSSSPFTHLYELLEEISRWGFNLLGAGVRDAVSTEWKIAIVSIGLVCGLGFAYTILRRNKKDVGRWEVWAPIVFSGVYFLSMMGLSSVIRLDDFSGRFLLPMIAPATIFTVFVLDRFNDLYSKKIRFCRSASSVIFLCALAIPVWATSSLAAGAKSFGVNQAASPAVVNSLIMKKIKSAAQDGKIVAADRGSAQFILVHFRQCVPIGNKDYKIGRKKMPFSLIRINGTALDAGTLQLGAPRLVFSRRPIVKKSNLPKIGNIDYFP